MNNPQNHINSKPNVRLSLSKSNNQITILGAGESGVGAAILAKQQGYDVFVSDLGEIKEKYKTTLDTLSVDYESGSHDEARILSSDLVIKSPGIPDKAPLIQKIKHKGIPIISEIEFASRYTNAKIIAITGTNGKTTTTMLTYHILKEAGYHVGLAGNIGDSFAKQVAADVTLSCHSVEESKCEQEQKHYVLELSSFQLDGIVDFKPLVSVLLNITPDHLDRYEYTFQKYIDSKFRTAENQTTNEVFIYWEDDEVITANLDKVNAVQLPYCYGYHSPDFKLQGRHNELNANAALLAAMSVGVDQQVIKKALNSFEPVKHRLQVVKTINGVDYINDSKATNVDAVYYALDGIEKPMVWIAGGVDKGNDYTVLFPFLTKIKALICLGKDNEKLKTIFNGKIEAIQETDAMHSAIAMASSFAVEGDVVLLSPACASFDLFKSYEHRGDCFIEEVGSLKETIRN